MAVKPIIFSAPMIKALLAGTKTQTRRILKAKPGMTIADCTVDGGKHPSGIGTIHELPVEKLAVRFAKGDVLYVRESYTSYNEGSRAHPKLVPMYAVDYEGFYKPDRDWNWTSSRFMPRSASRLTLAVSDVRVQRLQDISEEDAEREGVYGDATGFAHLDVSARFAFGCLWDSIHGKDARLLNPWIVALTFTVHRQNVDAYLKATAHAR